MLLTSTLWQCTLVCWLTANTKQLAHGVLSYDCAMVIAQYKKEQADELTAARIQNTYK